MVQRSGVLIETYWNVNVIINLFSSSSDSVLIETYWNVNFFKFENIQLLIRSINRNILECKHLATVKAKDGVDVLIETYWNVNLYSN